MPVSAGVTAFSGDGRVVRRLTQIDLLAVSILLGLSLAWALWHGTRLDNLNTDQGWYLQAASRVLSGEVLYRDLLWMYPPLPVHLLARLFHLGGETPATLSIMQHTLGAIGCVLSYRAARFLLPPALALLGTVSVFLGGELGGFLAYSQAYTGGIALGAVLGLACVICVIKYLQGRHVAWVGSAGLTAGLAALSKPEFGFATWGTGLVLLGFAILHPLGFDRSRRSAVGGFAAFVAAGFLITGPVLVLSAAQSGWGPLLEGVGGYDQDLLLLRYWPPWGTRQSLGMVLAGLGGYLLAALLIVTLVASNAALRHWPALLLATLAGAALIGLRQIVPFFDGHLGLPSVQVPEAAPLEGALRFLWAGATLLLAILAAVIAVRWWQAWRQGRAVVLEERAFAVLVLYSALADARSFLHPAGTFNFHYLGTTWPVLVFSATELLPRVAIRAGDGPARRQKARALVAAVLVAYATLGLVWDAHFMSMPVAKLETARGPARMAMNTVRKEPWVETIRYVLANTGPGDAIAVLGHDPGLYFFTARTNLLRQDTLLPLMRTGPGDVADIIARLDSGRPALIIVPQSVRSGGVWFWDLPEGREAYRDLAPLWQWLELHYQRQKIVGNRDGYNYEVWVPWPVYAGRGDQWTGQAGFVYTQRSAGTTGGQYDL